MVFFLDRCFLIVSVPYLVASGWNKSKPFFSVGFWLHYLLNVVLLRKIPVLFSVFLSLSSKNVTICQTTPCLPWIPQNYQVVIGDPCKLFSYVIVCSPAKLLSSPNILFDLLNSIVLCGTLYPTKRRLVKVINASWCTKLVAIEP